MRLKMLMAACSSASVTPPAAAGRTNDDGAIASGAETGEAATGLELLDRFFGFPATTTPFMNRVIRLLLVSTCGRWN